MKFITTFEIGEVFWFLHEYYFDQYIDEYFPSDSRINEPKETYWGILGKATITRISPEIMMDSYIENLTIRVQARTGAKTFHNFKRLDNLISDKKDAQAECDRRNLNKDKK